MQIKNSYLKDNNTYFSTPSSFDIKMKDNYLKGSNIFLSTLPSSKNCVESTTFYYYKYPN